MPSEKATALVLRVIDFSETSCVVTLFSKEFGKLRALAKGGRRPKGPFEAALDLLALCRIVFLRKSSDALDLLTEAKLVRRFRPAGSDLASLYAAYYVAELMHELTDDYDPHPPFFDLADTTLSALADGGPVERLTLRFELATLRLLGHMPLLDRCVECGTTLAKTRRVPFGPIEGGVLCSKCRHGKRHVISVSEAVIAMLGAFATNDQTWQEITLNRAVYGEARAVLNHYLTHLVGHKLRMHAYLGTLF
ncbi:MAG: DNA repair protein RecO [Pirellulales bacterium]|nr:DNA repair protein RecO [Pirellulales bacterium]